MCKDNYHFSSWYILSQYRYRIISRINSSKINLESNRLYLGHKMFYNIMRVLDEQDGIDSELLVFAMTLINKTLYGIPDQEKFKDRK